MDVQEFLDRSILKVIVDNDPNPIIDNVLWTIKILDHLYGQDALIPHKEAHSGIAKRFSLRSLEAIVVGIARNKKIISNLDNPNEFIKLKVEDFWKQQAVVELSASGLRGTTRIQRTVPFGEKWFRPNE
ncbi:MAG: hypothetical protein EBU46_05275 [Nitrosomonadaceae bacterium]|nr:hypothetical protein [Nitrosomonadaceae bacterium]